MFIIYDGNENVYYINVKPYHFSMPYFEMAIRYFEEFTPEMPYHEFITKIEGYMDRYNYTVVSKGKEETEVG